MPRPQNEKENLQFVQELAEIDGPFESPININFRDLTKLELPPLVWNRSDTVPKKMKLTNTGHTVILSGRWNRERPYLTGGPLDGNYVFSQVHFHWGPDNCRGSEHTVCGEKFPLEMHVAHFKTEYLTQEAALQEKDGMVVLVYLFKLQEEPNLSLKRIISALTCIREASTSTQIDARSILALLNPFTDDYFMYWGSVVTNTCAHILLWIICREPFGISKDQLCEFRKVMDNTLQPILRNNREPQPLHGRNVFHVNASRHLDKAMLPIKKIMGCFCNEQNDGMGDEEGNDTKRRQSSCRCCCNKSRPQEEIEDKKTDKCQDQRNGSYSRHMVYVQHATVPYNPAFRQKTTQEEPPPDRGQGEFVIQEEVSESTEKQEVSESCCFLPVKECKKVKSEKDTVKEKPKKKSFDSVKALSNIIDSLEALKNHTYKKLQELDAINTEIKELKKHCEDSNEQRWLRKMERIISRQKRYTLRTSRCCFSELKRLAKEYHIDKILEGRIVTSTDDDKIFTINENEDLESPEYSEGSKNNQVATCYSLYKQERFSKKAQKLIKSFFEDIKENEEAEQSVQKDLQLRKISKYRLDDELSRTGASSVDGSSKNFITQQMFNLGDFGHRFFTEIPPEKEEGSKEIKKQKDDKIIPLRRADILFKYKNKHRALKKSSASSLSVLIVNQNASEKKVVKKKPKKVKETLVKKYKKKTPKIQYVTYTSDGTSNDELLITQFTKQRSRKDLWENPSTISIRPMISSAKKKKIIIEKSLKRKLKHSKKDGSKREQEVIVETIRTMSEGTLTPSEREICKVCRESPERKMVKLESKRKEDLLAVCRYEDPKVKYEEFRVKYEEPKVKYEKYEEPRIKHEECRIKYEEHKVKNEEPRVKYEELKLKHEESRMKQEEPRVKYEEPHVKQEESRTKHEEPKVQHAESRVIYEEPKVQHAESKVKYEEPRVQNAESRVKNEELQVKHEEPQAKYEEHNVKNEERVMKYDYEEIKPTDEESDRTTADTTATIGDSVMKNKPITPLEFSQEYEEAKLKELGDELSKRSWTAPTSMTRDASAEKRRLFVAPKREKSIQRRATSPVIVYHTTDSSENPPPTLHRYEIHDHDNTERTFNQTWSSESKLSNLERQQLLEKELFDGETYANGTDSNDSCDKPSKSVKSDVTVFSTRSSENDEHRIRRDGKNRTMSAFSFNSARAMYHKKRKHRQMHKNKSTPSTVRVLDTIESSRLEFSHLTEEEQLQIISANVASFVKQKLLEHKKGTDDEDDENKEKSTFEEIEKNVLKELQTPGDDIKKDDEDSDTLENRWSTAVLKVPSVLPVEKHKSEVKEIVVEDQKKPQSKQTHNFIKRNKMMAGKYKRKNVQKKPDGPKKPLKTSGKSTTEPTSSDKSPTRTIKPHACGNVVKSPEEKAQREKSITAPKNPRASSVSKKPTSPENQKKSPERKFPGSPERRTPGSPERKSPESREGGTRIVPTVPSAVVPKKRWVPTYTLTSYLQAPTEVIETQQRKLNQCYFHDSEDENDMKLRPFNLQTNDLEYLIKLEMCISNEIAANIENSMNYVKTLLSQDYNGTAIIEKPPVKDSFNIFDPVNSGILLIELNDCLQSDSTTGIPDGIYRHNIQSKKMKKKRRIRRKWSNLYRKSDSGEQSLDSECNNNDSDGGFGKNETESEDVSKMLEKYIYHLGRGEESNINLTEKSKTAKTEEVNQISKIKPHLRKRKEKLLLSVEMKDKLLEVLTEEMKREIEDKQKIESASASESVSSPENTSTGTPSNVICECERTELWTEMLRKFLQDNKNIIEGNGQGINYSGNDRGQGFFKDC